MRCPRLGLCGLAVAALLGSGTVSPVAAHPDDPCRDLVSWPLYVAGLPAEPLAAFLRANSALAEQFIQGDPNERTIVVPAGALDGVPLQVQQLQQQQQPQQQGVQSPQLPAVDVSIGGLGITIEIDVLGDLLARIEADPRAVQDDLPEQFGGIAGMTTLLFLQKLLPLDGPPVADKLLKGRIRDYTFVRNPASADPATGRGHLGVDVCTDINGFVKLGDDRREFFHWDLETVADGFVVDVREEPTDPADPSTYAVPFPGMAEVLPEMSWNPAYPTSVWRRGLDHKLQSRGTYFVVRNVYHRKLSEPDLVRLDDAHDAYQVTPASCIDLFTQGTPPATFGELAANDYCLGRCAHPPIVNSGD